MTTLIIFLGRYVLRMGGGSNWLWIMPMADFGVSDVEALSSAITILALFST
jgi:hypothetical protein